MRHPPAAVILATVPAAGGEPAALLHIAGETLLERHARSLALAGVREVCVVAHSPGLPERHLAGLRRLGLAATALTADGPLAVTALPPALRCGELLVTDASLLLDRRVAKLLAASDGEAVCLLPAAAADPEDVRRAGTLPLAGEPHVFAGCARLAPGSLARLAFPSAGDLAASLAALVAERPALARRLPSSPPYDPDQKTVVPWLYLAARIPGDDARGTAMLLAAARKETLDWPALYVHRPIEDWIIARICRWPVTPNQLTAATNALAFPAAWLLASGRLGAGVALALVVGVLDGLDGKQARVKLIFSPIGHWEHHLDKLYENAWWFGIAWHLSGRHGPWAWAVLGILVGANLLDLAVAGAYRAKRGVQLDDAGRFERRFRLVAGRRNTYVWAFLPFVAAGEAAAGFATLAAYAVVSLGVRVWRSLKAPAREGSAA